jgi:hypothetical protein
MAFNRRHFLKTAGATTVALAASDLVADLIAQSPSGRALASKFKGLSEVALGEATRLGVTYADIRFTRNINDSVGVRDRIVADGGFGGGGGGGFGGGGGRNESAGFGVRVLFPQFDRVVMRADWGFPLTRGVVPTGGFPGDIVVTFRQAFPMPALPAAN